MHSQMHTRQRMNLKERLALDDGALLLYFIQQHNNEYNKAYGNYTRCFSTIHDDPD